MNSPQTTKLLQEQEEIQTTISQALINFKKLNAQRRTIENIQKCADKLSEEWDQYKINHVALLASNDLASNHPYLADSNKNMVQKCVEEFRTVINTFMEEALKDQKPDPTMTISINNSLKNQETLLASFKAELDAYAALPQDQKTLTIMREVKQKLQRKWNIIQKLHDKLSISDDTYDVSSFITAETNLDTVIQELGAFDPIVEPIPQPANNGNDHNTNLRLPKITVPTFDGDYLKWKAFQELFFEMIGSKNISGTQKLIYLRQNVSGEAGKLVQHLQVTEANYDIAWQALENRYNNERLITAALLDKIFMMENAKNESAESLKKMHDTVTENLNALETMNISPQAMSSIMFHHLILKKLDEKSHSLYEQSLANSRKTQTLPQLLVFLEKRFQALEAIGKKHKPANPFNQNNNNGNSNAKHNQPKQTTALVASSNNHEKKACGVCKGDHPIFKCPAFLKLSPNDRYKKVKEMRKCVNCLKDKHEGKIKCPSKKCITCNKGHNTLLHFESKQSLLGSAINNPDFEHVFLATAIIQIIDQYGNFVNARVLLDSGSQVSMMTSKLHQKIGISYQPTSMTISGVGVHSVVSKKRSIIHLQSIHSSFKAELEVFVVKHVTTCQPADEVNIEEWKIPGQIQLADPKFNIPAQIDMVIGGELFYKLLSNGFRSIGEGLPDLQNTVFGWVVIGKLLGLKTNNAFAGISIRDGQTLDNQLAKFWQVEEKYKPAHQMTDAEIACEDFYEQTTRRNKTGRFIVRLQFTKEPSSLGDSEHMAIRRFLYLEKRLGKNPIMQAEYAKFMHEYEQLDHMEEVDRSSLGNQHYIIPHHYVLNPGSSTTKFRVVFDASAKTTSNVSLNEILANGPMLQDDLFSIMVRFRKHQYVFTADISKMYRQILVDPSETKWQVIVWRSDSSQQLQYYKLKTLTYGTTCASYLAIKSLQKLADIEQANYPLAAVVAKRDFNVDDVMTGTDDIMEAVHMQSQLIDMLQLAGFELHKWCSNHPMLLERIPKKKHEISLDINNEKTETKALGMKWIPKTDKFMLHYDPRDHKVITKRAVLSETAQLYDPLGLVNPVIVLAKIFLQELWAKKLDWDEPLNPELQSKWTEFRKDLTKLNQVVVPRHMLIENATNIQLHAFSDASIRAYGTAIYIRSENECGEVQVNLVCSKSRVAPVNQLTLPRLELCGSLVMVELVEKLKQILAIDFDKITYWTDSEIVLSWIYADSTYKTFVANRVASIKRKTRISDWRYIDTKSNPADLISRGVLPDKLLQSELWWHGPEFLQSEEKQWPLIKPTFVKDENEEKIIKTVLLAAVAENKNNDNHFISRINHRNSIRTLNRVVAYCLRFGTKNIHNKEVHTANLTVPELKTAMIKIIKYCQNEAFEGDFQHIKEGNPHKTSFSNLSPIIDQENIIRVGGRIQAASIPFEQKHPALLPKDHIVTRLIMERIHLENMHASPQALLAITRQKYWPINGKRLAQSIVKQCILCARSKPKLMEQVMGNLPAERVNTARPFIHTGIDFAGPIMVHYKIRGKRASKAYICLFVCFATKAIHIEAAPDLTTAGFISCLKRFIARRGLPQKIFCDNAKTFEGSKNQLAELAELTQSEQHQNEVIDYSLDHQIEWKFIPPRSPHFGGLWESAVKSAKLHLIKVLHNATLTFDELSTVLAEIEAILNSRPLTPMSNDPNDLQPLTAGHFLIGAPLVSFNDESLVLSSKMNVWAKIRAIKGEFWNRWSKEYLSELQYRNKWTKAKANIEIGTMVTLREDNTPPLKWRMGRVVSTNIGSNGKIRVVEVRTKKGILKRSIHQISPLPVDIKSNESEPSKSSSVNTTLNPETAEFIPIAHRLRSFNKKQENAVIQATTNSTAKHTNRRTSKNAKWSTKMAIMAIGIFSLIMGISGTMCNVTSFKSNPGLYFEEIGQLSLSNDEWNLICYMNMSSYWAEGKVINNLITKLNETCPLLHTTEYCDSTTGQFVHQLSIIDQKDALIQDFSHNHLSRKKRGWFNVGGTAAKHVFGLMDADDANHYDQEIKQLTTNENHLMNLIRNPTIIQDITTNIIKHDEELVAKQLKHMQEEITSLKNDEHAKAYVRNVYNALSLQLVTLMAGYKEVQSSIVETLTNIHNGRVPPVLITPTQISKQLLALNGKIPNHLMWPVNEQSKHISQLYTMLTAKARITSDNLIVQIKIPLINREFFKLYHIISVPFIYENTFQTILPSTKYIGVNPKQDHYYMLDEEERMKCKVINEGQLICKQDKPLYSVQPNNTQCEMTIILQPNDAHKICNVKEIKQQQVWSRLAKLNQFLYTVRNMTSVNIICNSDIHHCTLDGYGILTLHPQCIMKSGSLEITSTNVLNSSIPMLLVPSTNNSKIINAVIRDPGPDNVINWEEFKVNSDLNKLQQTILNQRQYEQFETNVHDIHHYIASYLILGIIIILVAAYIYKFKRKLWLNHEVEPSNAHGTISSYESNDQHTQTTSSTQIPETNDNHASMELKELNSQVRSKNVRTWDSILYKTSKEDIV